MVSLPGLECYSSVVNFSMRTYSHFIGGEWVAARPGQTFRNSNPADTRETVAEYPSGQKEDAQAAIQAAQKAFPSWSAMTPVARGRNPDKPRLLKKVTETV